MSYYEPQRPGEPGGCGEVWLLTRIALGVILPVIAVLIGVLILLFSAFYLLSVHPLLALLPIGAMAGLLAAFAYWERRGHGPPPAR
jgi:hypothetical protein